MNEQEFHDPGTAERLEIIAATNAEAYTACVCRGVAMWLRKHYQEEVIGNVRLSKFMPEDMHQEDWGVDKEGKETLVFHHARTG